MLLYGDSAADRAAVAAHPGYDIEILSWQEPDPAEDAAQELAAIAAQKSHAVYMAERAVAIDRHHPLLIRSRALSSRVSRL